jgi:transcriptional regulator with XRE-family HTH domain
MSRVKINSNTKALLKVSEKLKELRINAGYSSYENFAHDYDLDRKQYWRMENGANITLTSLLKILHIYKLSLRDFFNDKLFKS